MRLVGLLLVVVASAFSDACERHGAKCPDYTVLQTYEDYEERRYPPMTWVSVSGHGKSKSDVSRKLIKQLYGYLGGANDQEKNIDMMVPVRTTKVLEKGSNTYTMAVIVPEQNGTAPQPLNHLIDVRREPATTYVVRSFSGYPRQDSAWDQQAESLRASVANDAAVNTTHYYMNVYDSPWRETDRLNEVWMIK